MAAPALPLHTHSVDGLIVVLEGTLEVSLGGQTHTLGPDHTVVIPLGTEHAFQATGGTPTCVFSSCATCAACRANV